MVGEGNGNPLQYSCLENPRDGGACWAAIYGVAQSRTWLPWLSSRRILTPLHRSIFWMKVNTNNTKYYLQLKRLIYKDSGTHDWIWGFKNGKSQYTDFIAEINKSNYLKSFYYHLKSFHIFCTFSVQFSCSVMSQSLQPHEPQHARPSCPSPTPRVHPNPCPLCQWCHPTISSSVVPFSSYPQSFPASGSFQMSQLSASGGQSIGVSASISVPPMNIKFQDLFQVLSLHLYLTKYSVLLFWPL